MSEEEDEDGKNLATLESDLAALTDKIMEFEGDPARQTELDATQTTAELYKDQIRDKKEKLGR